MLMTEGTSQPYASKKDWRAFSPQNLCIHRWQLAQEIPTSLNLTMQLIGINVQVADVGEHILILNTTEFQANVVSH